MEERTKYTPDQLAQYFTRINLPTVSHVYDVSNLDAETQLQYLTLLTKHQITKIPFESLDLHYSWHRTINAEAQHVFQKIVLQPGRGGYCMENNTLFHTVLLSLGYDVYLVGARVFSNGAFLGLCHCLNIVTIADQRYVVEVGYGTNQPLAPLKLYEGETQLHIGSASVRLRSDSIAPGVKRDEKVWILEHRRDDTSQWITSYCFFSEWELLLEDVAVINYWPQKHPASVFMNNVLCLRATTEDEKDGFYTGIQHGESDCALGEIDGMLILFGNSFKWRRKGETTLKKQLDTELERMEVLKNYFGITLSEGDQRAIRGTYTELKGHEALV